MATARSTESRAVLALDHERVIAAVDEMQRRARKRRDELAHFVGRAEWIASAVQEQHRCRDARQVLVAALGGLVRRMKRIAEKDERGRRRIEPARPATCDAMRPPIDLPAAIIAPPGLRGGVLPDLLEVGFEDRWRDRARSGPRPCTGS